MFSSTTFGRFGVVWRSQRNCVQKHERRERLVKITTDTENTLML